MTGPGESSIGTGRKLQEEARKQIQSWSLDQELARSVAPEQASHRLAEEIHPYVAVSREAGAGGSTIINRVGELLDLAIIDRELLNYLAEHCQLPRDVLEVCDEKTSNWLVEALGIWLSHRLVSESDYVMLLGRFVLMSARKSSIVFAGRGIQLILPRERGLAVNIVAPWDRRVECIMERNQLTRQEAERHMARRDAGRREFVRRHFRSDPSDPHLYDLVINTEMIDTEGAAEIIVNQWLRRFGGAYHLEEMVHA